ncbi:MAG: HAD family hydrolase [Ruminococcus sp.]|nr:HAD family hydrolase [Ruminococcus sp.]MDE6848264.1 HAD family hydrolase [Ruminococcus sp.]
MNTLYVSDLDGTLLRSNETTSEYTNRIINSFTEKGMIFSYATARSLITAKKVTDGLTAKIPLIVYNGAFVIDNISGKLLIENYFDNTVESLLEDLFNSKVYPIVYSFIDGEEKFSFVPKLCTQSMNDFIDSRKGDIRRNPVKTVNDLKSGKIFYITCIDDPQKLELLYEKYRNDFHCVYQKDIYSKSQWLEIMPKQTSKSNAIKQLQKLVNCERLIVFGDGKNDIDMFQLADESYAVKNAHDELKKYATAIIPSNNDDGVAKWLEHNYNP